MLLEPGLVSYAALASLALAVKKHRPSPPLAFMPSVETARLGGWTLLGFSILVAIFRFGPEQGTIAWVGQFCVSGAILVLLLSWRPRWALLMAAPAIGTALLTILI